MCSVMVYDQYFFVIMLTELYIEALLVDGELADQIRVAWDKGPAQRTINSVES